MKILSPAKINLFLEVGEKKGKLHPIVSLVDPISLFDTIEIKKSKHTKITFHSVWKIPENNTVKKAVDLFRKKFNISDGFEINIWKKIPPGSGLGGGSSNAAAVLKYLLRLFRLKLKKEELLNMAIEIGSDVPFFLYNKISIVSGYGEIVEPFDINTPIYYLLLIPDREISTSEVYNQLDKDSNFGDLTKGREKIKILIDLLKNADVEKMRKIMFNRLENFCFKIWKEGKEVMERLEEVSGRSFFLSGSGGCIFSLFREENEVRKVSFKVVPEGWKSFIVKRFQQLKQKEEIDGNN